MAELDQAERDPNATSTVRIKNSGSGPRYVHTTDGPVIVPAGTTSGDLTVRDCELAALPDGLEVSDGEDGDAMDADDANAPGFRQVDQEGGAGEGTGMVIPDDLKSDRSADGIVGREKLLEVAKAETVEYEGDDNKGQLLAKIVAHRAAKEANPAT